MSDHQRFTALPATECQALLRQHTIGRVGWTSADGPQILPVTYVLRDGAIVFRTSPYGVLAGLRDGVGVAFEIDEFDVATRTGWSVLVQGRAAAAANPDELAGRWLEDEPIPWATGIRNLYLVITPDHLSGRALSA